MKVALLALAAVVAGCGGSGPQSSDRVAPTSVATVTTRTLTETTPVSGKLGYAGGYTVLGGLSGSITALPAVGQVIRNGQTIYRVDDAPVTLLYGSTPAYRALAEGVTGTDVWQLNRDLVALGYASRADLDPSLDEFNWATRVGVEQLQHHLGVLRTGVLASGQIVFLPTAARVTDVRAVLGGPAGGAVLSATSTAREVSVDLDAGLQSQVKRGDRVTHHPARQPHHARQSLLGRHRGHGGLVADRPRADRLDPAGATSAASTRRPSRWRSPTRPCTARWWCRWTRCWRWPAAATPSRSPTRTTW